MILFPFLLHSPVLEPDFDLPLAEMQTRGNLDPPPPRQVAIGHVFPLQLRRLVTRVRLAPLPVRRDQS